MRRRTLPGFLASLGLVRARDRSFPGEQAANLKALARVVLPSELGPARLDAAAGAFAQWVRGYRDNAERFRRDG